MPPMFGVSLAIAFVLINAIGTWHLSPIHILSPRSTFQLLASRAIPPGNLRDLQAPENSVGDADFAWVNKYGTMFNQRAIRAIPITAQKDLLYLADPKGLQYVLNTGGYSFPRPKENRFLWLFLLGPGLVFAEGGQHARQRKVISPALSYNALKGFLPLFFPTAAKLSDHWRHIVQDTGSSSTVVDVSGWISRMSLDVIGTAAFNHEFNVLDNSDDELAQALNNLLSDAFARANDATIAAQAAINYLPFWIHNVIIRIPTKPIKRLAHYMSTARLTAQGLVTREREAMSKGTSASKDMMSLLIRADGHEDPKKRLSADETYAQMTTLMMAGHETTAYSITWLLYEVAKHPEAQQRIREEIKTVREAAAARGEGAFDTITNLETMNYTLATIKETLRLHPVGPWLRREAGQDDVIPLSNSLRTNSGDHVTAIPVSKGQEILVSTRTFPEEIQCREVGLGVISNLATFSSGLRNCVAWRFAHLEMQAMLIELVQSFDFAVTDAEIIRVFAVAMTPMVKGQADHGSQLPLMVTPLS